MGYGSSSRNGVRVKNVILHTAEGSRTKESLASFLWNNDNASAHVGIDAGGILDMIPRDLAAWTVGGGNSFTVNAEICGFARWTREQWLSTGVVDGCNNPRQMVYYAAQWAKRECLALGLPMRLLNIGDTGDGIEDHYRLNQTYGFGDHHNVGSGFPWDVFFNDIRGAGLPGEKSIDMGVHLIKGSEKAEIWLVEVSGNGASKKHLRTMQLVQVFEALLGEPTRTVDQWKIDFIGSTGSIG